MPICRKCKGNIDDTPYCPLCGAAQHPAPHKALKRPNGSGTVYKLSGRRSRPWVAARDRIIIGYYAKKTEALEALAKTAGKRLTERYNMTFGQVYQEWSAEHFPRISQTAATRYQSAYKMFEPLCEEKMRNIRTADYQSIIDAHIELSPASLANYKQLITQMSKWALREEVIETDFSKFVVTPPIERREKGIFTDTEIRKLEQDGSETAMIALMLIGTGMRIGELFALPLADCHGDYVIGGEKTDAGRNRVIPIRPEAQKYFSYFAACATGELLLSGYTGSHVIKNYRERDYYPLLERLGIERKTPHCTRHTYASRARKEGMDPKVLQLILGHADYDTTANIYIHVDPQELIDAVVRPDRKVAEIVSGNA